MKKSIDDVPVYDEKGRRIGTVVAVEDAGKALIRIDEEHVEAFKKYSSKQIPVSMGCTTGEDPKLTRVNMMDGYE